MRSSLERNLPVFYFALSVVLIAAVLPTTLRPPQPRPPTSAEFAPDAPPDEDFEVILSELSRGTTTTAGSGEEVSAGGGGAAQVSELVELAPRRGLCYGDPPRQAESIYSPPCAAAWIGDNGGQTWRGVTSSEVRIGVVRETGDGYEGFVDAWEGDQGSEPAHVRTWRVWQTYFNQRYELYGRQLRIVVLNGGMNWWQEDSESRSAVMRADVEFGVFGMVVGTVSPPAQDEALRRELVTFGGYGSQIELYRDNAPYAWSWFPDSDKSGRMSVELMCKQLHGKPVEFTTDEAMRGEERMFGVISYQAPALHNRIDGYRAEFDGQCGGGFEESLYYNLDDQAHEMATVITRMRAAGITTIMCDCDPFSALTFTNSADSQAYYPEWVVPGAGLDLNAIGALQSPHQWRNVVGTSFGEIPGGRPSGSDGLRAYKEIDPSRSPSGAGFGFFEHLQQFAAGIQLAGPNLTPHSFQEGLQTRWPKRPPDPGWTIGGGYAPGDWTFPDYVALIWWDSGEDAYRFVYDGQRFTDGEIPTERVPFFEDGILEPPPDERW